MPVVAERPASGLLASHTHKSFRRNSAIHLMMPLWNVSGAAAGLVLLIDGHVLLATDG